jgi:DNA-binding Lrp family transcriptional regulator
MTQEQLADATGLTPVHVNRTLKALQAEGLIVRNKRKVSFPDWSGCGAWAISTSVTCTWSRSGPARRESGCR